ncbi:MAG: site-specific integrase [Gemmatimonadetes bacterium]|nr:site-specific integrase [Gemmatimonadota bacterium]MXX71342.1 site-specific integrase [Gemmatimonadota bacterium]MYC93125.1 site-specific integrase [Gemmatimonadota bacterium]MYG36518.1 site-specific integrase [Gemmatimonadota bacterium]
MSRTVHGRGSLGVSRQFDWRFHLALVLAHETGHRIGAIRQLRWSDIDLDGGVVRWRAEHEKTGYEHCTPVTAEALAALGWAQRRNPGAGKTPVLPASTEFPSDPQFGGNRIAGIRPPNPVSPRIKQDTSPP